MLTSTKNKIIKSMLKMKLEKRPLVRVTVGINVINKHTVGVLAESDPGMLLLKGLGDAPDKNFFIEEIVAIVEVPPLQAAGVINRLLANAENAAREASKAQHIISTLG